MFGKPSLTTRIAVGKTVGLIFGLIGFLVLPYILPEVGLMQRWGFLFWYVDAGGDHRRLRRLQPTPDAEPAAALVGDGAVAGRLDEPHADNADV